MLPNADLFHNNVWTVHNVLNHTGTYPFFGIVYLQRLADPTHSWDPDRNPYRTIDSMQIDLTCFNGIYNPSTSSYPDPDDPSAKTDLLAANKVLLNTRERGRFFLDQATASPLLASNLWAHEPEVASGRGASYYPQVPPTAAMVSPNPAWKPPIGTTPAPTTCNLQTQFSHSLGYLNQAFGLPRTSPPGYEGAPRIPYAALPWNNRPFTTPLELLAVPQTSSSQLLATSFVPANSPPVWATFLPALKNNPFFIPAALSPPAFGYLTNPFYPGPVTPTVTATLQGAAAATASPLVRMLDFVEVPSPFVSARTQLDPTAFSNSSHVADLPFLVPYNWISNYRNPGKINLNTITAPQVWQGLINYFPDATQTTNPLWTKFVTSRRGFTSSEQLDPRFETRASRHASSTRSAAPREPGSAAGAQ